jgi:hypothetical protein
MDAARRFDPVVVVMLFPLRGPCLERILLAKIDYL